MIRRGASLVAALACSVFPASIAGATPQEVQRTWSVEDSLEVRSRIQEAERLLDLGLTDRAVPQLQEILERWGEHLVADKDDPLRFVGARTWVQRRIATFTGEQRRIYAAKIGPRAERELASALARRDVEALTRVADLYERVDDVGARALLALADLHLASGRPGHAIGPLDLLLRRFPETPWSSPQVMARLVRARTGVQDIPGLRTMKDRLAGEPGPVVRLGEREVPLATLLDESLAAVGATALTDAFQRRDTPTLGGDIRRSGSGPPVESLGPPRWTDLNRRFGWTNYDSKQQHMESSVSNALEHAEPAVPAIAEGVVYLNWNFDLLARDLYTGRVLWRYTTPHLEQAENGRTHGALLLSPTVEDGVVYAALQTWPAGARRETVWFANQVIIPHIPVRRLVALDAATGRPRWSHLDPRPQGDPFDEELRWLNVTSAPLVVGDLVLAAGATYSSGFTTWAFATDRRTGRVVWKTRLGYGQQELNLFGRPVKEIPVAAVASDGRRAWVQTNAGIVACVDVATGNTQWVRGYDQVTIPYYQNFWSTPERAFTFTGSPPVVSGESVICAPADGPDLLVMEAETGRLRWSLPAVQGRGLSRSHHWQVLGADDRRLYLAGTSVRAHEIATRALVWERFFKGTRDVEASDGRGIVSDGRVHVPSNRAFYVFEAGSGKLLQAEPWQDAHGRERRGGGNVVSAEGAAVVCNLYRIEGFFRPEDVRDRAVARANARPHDPEALLEAARIFLAADRPAEAVPYLERAVEAASTLPVAEREVKERAARELLFEVWVDQARRLDAEGSALDAAAAWRTAAARAPEPLGTVFALLQASESLLRGGREEEAIAALESVVADHGATLLPRNESGSHTAAAWALHRLHEIAGRLEGPTAAVGQLQRIFLLPDDALLFGQSARNVARVRIDDLLRLHGRGIYALFEAEAQEALERARGSHDPEALAGLTQHWPNAEAAAEAGLVEARWLLETSPREAVMAARRVLGGSSTEAQRIQALWLMADALGRSGKTASARATLERLLRLHPDGMLVEPAGNRSVADAVAQRLSSEDLAGSSTVAPLLPASGGWRTQWERSWDDAPRMVVPEGETVPGGLLLMTDERRVRALGAASGEEAWQRDLGDVGRDVGCAGSTLVFARGRHATGLDAGTGSVSWTVDLPCEVADLAVVDGVFILLLADPAVPDRAFLLALDPLDGKPTWGGPRVLAGGATALEALEGAVMVTSSGTSAPVVRVVEAADGAIRAFFVNLMRPNERTEADVLAIPGGGPLVLQRERSLEGYDVRTGAALWNRTLPRDRRLTGMAASARGLAFADMNETVELLDPLTGLTRWSRRMDEGRELDSSGYALEVDDSAVYTLSRRSEDGGDDGLDLRLDAWSLETGEPLWSAPLSPQPVLPEIAFGGDAVLVRFLALGRGDGRTGVLVVDRATGEVRDRFVDDRLAGEPFDAEALGGCLVIVNSGIGIARGR